MTGFREKNNVTNSDAFHETKRNKNKNSEPRKSSLSTATQGNRGYRRITKKRLKQDMKRFKQELTMLSEVQKKNALKQRKEQIEHQHQLKEKDYLIQLQQNATPSTRRSRCLQRDEARQKQKLNLRARNKCNGKTTARNFVSSKRKKNMRAFKERLKQEMKIFKQELTMLSEVQRKHALKQRKEQIEHEHPLKKKDFLIQLRQNANAMLQRMGGKHKERMAPIEKQLLMQKQWLLRAKENDI
ncbi:hypothetical protein B9Z55_026709 [Caenorhabditis nigoni]|nr:hypothetical protein B9Z55_026709 [Caenorhabditis nigoni]